MATKLKRLTFVVTTDMEAIFDEFKRENYNMNHSEVIRYLIERGFLEWQKETKAPQLLTQPESGTKKNTQL